MDVLYKKILFWFGLGLVLPIASFASGVNSIGATDLGINFDTYVTSADYYKVGQESNNVSKYISDISDDGFENRIYIPRMYLAGNTGTDLVWQGDVLVPALLTNDQAFIFYTQGRYSPGNKKFWEYSTWVGSAGLLYRQIGSSTDSVFGAYILGDYNRAASGHKYWVIGPGIESLGRKWDFRLNGYIPTSSRFLENEAWARELGDYNYTEFVEGTNNIYDHRLAYYEETGIGGDFEVGRKLFKVGNAIVKGYVQGYYYNMEHASNVIGGGLKITAQPAKYITFSINNIYDKYQHNVFMLGAQIRLNNLFNRSNKPLDENNLSNRLLDPISRNYGSIGIGTSSPIIKASSYDLGKGLYSATGIFFADHNSGYISPNAVQYRKGTYGNPYTEEGDIEIFGMQAILDEIKGNFSGQIFMFFAPGSYQAADGGLAINLHNNISVFGRDYWYTTPTMGDQRALFLGSINLFGSNVLDSIRIQNASLFPAGLVATNANNIILNNIEVGTLSNIGSGNYVTGITMNSSNISIANSKIYGYQNGAATADGQINATGIEMINGGSLVIFGSEIKGVANEMGNVFNQSGNGYGVYADGKQETITVQNGSTIIGQGQGGALYSGNGYGVLIGANYLDISSGSVSIEGNVVNIFSGSILQGNGNNGGLSYSGNGYGLLIGYNYANNHPNGTNAVVLINDNIVSVAGATLNGLGYVASGIWGNGYGLSIGFCSSDADALAGGHATYSIYNNTVDASASFLKGNTYGVLVGSNDSHISAYANSAADFNSYNNSMVISSGSFLIGNSSYSSGINLSNGYGLFIGHRYFSGLADGTGGVNLLVYGNSVTILSSSLIGNGYEDYGFDYASNGYGLVVGYAEVRGYTYDWNSRINMSTYGNYISISDSTLLANGNGSGITMSGNAYGVLIDSDELSKTGLGITTNTVRDNHISFDSSTITANSIGSGGEAWGINIGKNADVASLNKLNLTHSIISLDAGTRNANGVWMMLNSGVLSIDGFTINSIMHNIGSGGSKICYPTGVCIAW